MNRCALPLRDREVEGCGQGARGDGRDVEAKSSRMAVGEGHFRNVAKRLQDAAARTR